MKHLSKALLAVIMAALIGTLFPIQVFADTPDYISEIKIGMGVESDDALKALNGYTVLKDGNDPVDLNKNAGAESHNMFIPEGKGNKVVYLGYKTTKNRNEAITDLALMNMKGGYDVNEYEILMETQLKSQIIPFVESFTDALEEYRANYVSKNKANKHRARYIHDLLNKFTDDDTGKPLGDLLLKKTKYEMGDDAYNALSKDEKKEHADIVTIIAQANGRATLMLENLITRAADTNNNTWLDRFASSTYDKLVDATGKTPTDAKKGLAKQYDDSAATVLDMWDDFRNELLGYNAALKIIKAYDEDAVNDTIEEIENIDDNISSEEKTNIIKESEKAGKQITEYSNARQIVDIYEKLSKIPYLDGSMLDFFMQDISVLEEDITPLYPLVAALSKGQLTGIEFVSLKELMRIALSDEEGYQDEIPDEINSVSIYEGVDRAIYQKGGVALTTEARRKGAQAYEEPEKTNSDLYRIMLYITIGVGAATVVSAVAALKLYMFAMSSEAVYANRAYDVFDRMVSTAWRNSRIATGMAVGLTVISGIMALITIAVNAKDMAEYYNVKFTPIPHYMVDEKDLIGYNKKGEKIVLKNQSAYYKAVTCNRTNKDKMFESVGTCADMNGDVGSQWLALYAVKNDIMQPILASSLVAKTFKKPEDAKIPAGYETGLHMFGTEAAFNLNSSLYDWNNEAPAVYVYYKTEEADASNAGANFSAGTLALTGGAGIAFGAVVTAIIISLKRNKKENKTQTV